MPVELPEEVLADGYLITADKSKLSPEAAQRWLAEESYWAKGIPLETVRRSFEHSFVAGVLKDGEQVGYARLVTDYSTFAHLCDVYVLPEHRGKGLSKALLRFLMNLDWVQALRNITLGTWDAQGLYRQFGFENYDQPERAMKLTLRTDYEPSGEGTSN